MAEHLTYKGMDITIAYEDEDHAEVRIEDRTFAMSRHGNGGLRMWACDEAYFMSDDLHDLVRHLVDYWYIVTDPNTAPFEGPRHGELPERPGGPVPAHGHEGHFTAKPERKRKGDGRKRGGGRSGGR